MSYFVHRGIGALVSYSISALTVDGIRCGCVQEVITHYVCISVTYILQMVLQMMALVGEKVLMIMMKTVSLMWSGATKRVRGSKWY